MEIDVKREVKRLKQEVVNLQQKLNQVQQEQNELTTLIVKKMGVVEYLLEGK